jgi:hypothetical protein
MRTASPLRRCSGLLSDLQRPSHVWQLQRQQRDNQVWNESLLLTLWVVRSKLSACHQATPLIQMYGTLSCRFRPTRITAETLILMVKLPVRPGLVRVKSFHHPRVAKQGLRRQEDWVLPGLQHSGLGLQTRFCPARSTRLDTRIFITRLPQYVHVPLSAGRLTCEGRTLIT